MKSKYLLGLVTAMFCCTAGASEFVYKIHESGLTATSPPLVAPSAPTVGATANFGSSAFKCAVPTGYQAGW
jgi:hypothetical protein